MESSSMKAENTLSRGRLQHCAFLSKLPNSAASSARERESELWRIRMLGISSNRLGGSEVLRPMVADVGLWRTDICTVRSGFGTGGSNPDWRRHCDRRCCGRG